ncbi:MAG: ABC transporter substrate-binding protein [Hyphomicrobiaceae bacterium]|nr:ABC transporter substrate-binding protein [Hyphomicrobiaceae bacterium]
MRRETRHFLPVAVAAFLAASAASQAQTINIGIGTQDTTTNTVNVGAVIRELKLLDKHLPKTGKYEKAEYKFDWQNFTSGPPVTNGMMANKLHFGAMGDYPLVVNGFTFQSNPESKSQLIAVSAYNIFGSGNGLMVHKDSAFFSIDDLKGKVVSVPFGSAAHGMLLKAFQDRKWGPDVIKLVSQTPEVGATNLQEKKIDGHANFVPFAELFPHRGFARKIFDGVETNAPTWHGVVVRTDFAEKYPEVVVGFLKATIEATNWIKKDPKLASEKIAEWTGIDKSVVYIFLGPSGIMTMDPTIKPQLVADAVEDAKVLQNLGRMKEFDVKAWVNDSYIRKAYAELGLDYEKATESLENYEVSGTDPFCNKPVTEPRKSGQLWTEEGGITAHASTACTLGALNAASKAGKKVTKAYVFDSVRQIQLFADQAYFVLSKDAAGQQVTPFMLKTEAEAAAAKVNGRVGDLAAAVQFVSSGS